MRSIDCNSTLSYKVAVLQNWGGVPQPVIPPIESLSSTFDTNTDTDVFTSVVILATVNFKVLSYHDEYSK